MNVIISENIILTANENIVTENIKSKKILIKYIQKSENYMTQCDEIEKSTTTTTNDDD